MQRIITLSCRCAGVLLLAWLLTSTAGAATIDFVDAAGNPAASYAVNTNIYVSVADATANLSAGVQDTVQVEVFNLSSEMETLTLYEVDCDSGAFTGWIPLENFNGFPGDGTVGSPPGSGVHARYEETPGVFIETFADTADAQVVFLDDAGLPAAAVRAGTTVRMRLTTVDVGSGSAFFSSETLLGGDNEWIELIEVGTFTGVYEGSLRVEAGVAVDFDGIATGTADPLATETITLVGSAFGTATLVHARLAFFDERGAEVNAVIHGDTLRLRVEDAPANLSAGLAESLLVVVTSGSDAEQLLAVETGANTGIFETTLASAWDGGSAVNNGLLSVVPGTTITARLEDGLGQTITTADADVGALEFELVDGGGLPIEAYAYGGTVHARLRNPDINTDPSLEDSVDAIFESLRTGDVETIKLTETGADTAIFVGSIPSRNNAAAVLDGVLDLAQDFGPPLRNDTIKVSTTGVVGLSTDLADVASHFTAFVDADGQPADTFVLGHPFHVRVEDHSLDPNFVDTIYVEVANQGIVDPVFLTETGPATGIFEGSLILLAELPANPGDELRVSYTSASLETSSDVATVIEAELFFIDETGQKTEEVPEGGPARLRLRTRDFGSSVETWTVDVTSFFGGDTRFVDLVETGPDTRVFEGSVQLQSSYTGGLFTANGPPPDQLTGSFLGTYATAVGQAEVVPAFVHFVDAFGQETATYAVGDTALVRVVDHNRNDPSLVDVIWAEPISSTTGGTLYIDLVETGADTGVFEAQVRLGSSTTPPDRLGITAGDALTFEHFHFNDPGSTVATATVENAAIRWIDADGNETTTFLEGSTAFIQLRAHDFANFGTITVDVTSELTGDFERVNLTEVEFENGLGTGLFEGPVTLRTEPTGGPQNLILSTWQTLETPADTLTASVKVLFDTVATVATTVPARLVLTDAAGAPVSNYAMGDTVHVRLEDHNFANQGVTNVTVTLSSDLSLDSESLVLAAAAESGFFEGSILLRNGFVAGDGVLNADFGENIRVVHNDYVGNTQTTANAGVVQARIFFLDDAGLPSAEVLESGVARVRLVSDWYNSDSNAVEQPSVDVSSFYGGDFAFVTVTETGPDTGVFEGSLALAGPYKSGLLTADSGPPLHLPEQLTADIFTFDGSALTTATLIDARAVFLDCVGQPVTVYSQGEIVRIRLEDHNYNDPTLVDTITDLMTGIDDNENLTLVETGLDTGIFEGEIPSTLFGGGSFNGEINAGDGDPATLHHTHQNDPGTTLFTVTFNSNLVPQLTDDSATTLESRAVTIMVTYNDFDPDSFSPLTVTAVGQGANGMATIAGEHVVYTPNPGFVGTDTFTYVVTDVDGGKSQANVTVTVTPNTPPDVVIGEPADGTAVIEGDSLTFGGAAMDIEDGPVTALAWTSSLDGAIGSGGSFTTTALSVGTHVITLTATDSHGATGTAQVNVTVNANTVPSVQITAPADGTVSIFTDSVTFGGTASDAEDGDLMASLSWTSSLDGAIGTGGSFTTVTLSVGSHVITASVTDSHGATSTAQITVTVNANTAPNVQITAPTDGADFTIGDSVTFSATALDLEDGDLAGLLAWTSSLDGVLGSGGSFTTAALSLGSHLISTTVTDSHGAVSMAQITVLIRPLPVQIVLTSIGAEDGYVRESAEGSGVGGNVVDSNTNSSAVRLGDDQQDRQYRAVLSFDTSSIPDGAEVQAVRLRLQRGRVRGTDPFTTHGSARVDVSTGSFGGDPALVSSDFEAPASAAQSATMSSPTANGEWSEGDLDAAGLLAVDRAGKTQFRVHFDAATNGDGGHDYVGFYSGENSNSSRHPQLMVTYQEF